MAGDKGKNTAPSRQCILISHTPSTSETDYNFGLLIGLYDSQALTYSILHYAPCAPLKSTDTTSELNDFLSIENNGLIERLERQSQIIKPHLVGQCDILGVYTISSQNLYTKAMQDTISHIAKEAIGSHAIVLYIDQDDNVTAFDKALVVQRLPLDIHLSMLSYPIDLKIYLPILELGSDVAIERQFCQATFVEACKNLYKQRMTQMSIVANFGEKNQILGAGYLNAPINGIPGFNDAYTMLNTKQGDAPLLYRFTPIFESHNTSPVYAVIQDSIVHKDNNLSCKVYESFNEMEKNCPLYDQYLQLNIETTLQGASFITNIQDPVDGIIDSLLQDMLTDLSHRIVDMLIEYASSMQLIASASRALKVRQFICPNVYPNYFVISQHVFEHELDNFKCDGRIKYVLGGEWEACCPIVNYSAARSCLAGNLLGNSECRNFWEDILFYVRNESKRQDSGGIYKWALIFTLLSVFIKFIIDLLQGNGISFLPLQ